MMSLTSCVKVRVRVRLGLGFGRFIIRVTIRFQ
jgi:hypothetical protein